MQAKSAGKAKKVIAKKSIIVNSFHLVRYSNL